MDLDDRVYSYVQWTEVTKEDLLLAFVLVVNKLSGTNTIHVAGLIVNNNQLA